VNTSPLLAFEIVKLCSLFLLKVEKLYYILLIFSFNKINIDQNLVEYRFIIAPGFEQFWIFFNLQNHAIHIKLTISLFAKSSENPLFHSYEIGQKIQLLSFFVPYLLLLFLFHYLYITCFLFFSFFIFALLLLL
jgi:hypothetical protein